mmetsp:Transcript_21215/g.38299  ORF Transcript_21215/g.38299 Transcript_21215/m.38299 type:complete len:693 (-) Transcript_21215:57-2135(-)
MLRWFLLLLWLTIPLYQYGVLSLAESSATIIHVDPVYGKDHHHALGKYHPPEFPFRTLARAAEELTVLPMSPRRIIRLRPGDYALTEPLLLDARHGNATWVRHTYTERDEDDFGVVRIRGGHVIDPSLFEPWNRHNIVVAPIPSHVVGDLGSIQSGGLKECANDDTSEVFVDGHPMVLARYPNVGHWDRIVNVTDDNTTQAFYFEGNRPLTHLYADSMDDFWLHGYWGFDWADNYLKVASLNASSRTFEIDTTLSPVLYQLTAGARYYAVNLLQELDAPGEYFIDRRKRLLYLYPPRPLTPTTEIILSTTQTLVEAVNVTDLSFVNINFDISRGTALNFTNVTRVNVSGGSVTNVGGAQAIQLWQAWNSSVSDVAIHQCACGGIAVGGGDRHELQSSLNVIRDNRISDYARWKRTYVPAIWFDGCGFLIHNNRISNAPHQGISGHGNDVTISNNIFHDLCYETLDGAAMYVSRSWADRGNTISGNMFSHIRTTEQNLTLGYPHVVAIYLDDQMSGYHVMNNTILDSDTGILLGGGRDNWLVNNRFIRTDVPLSFDSRGKYDAQFCPNGHVFEQELESYGYRKPPWSDRYSELHGTFGDDGMPCTPVHNWIDGFHWCTLHGLDKNRSHSNARWIETPGTNLTDLISWGNNFMNVKEDPSLCHNSNYFLWNNKNTPSIGYSIVDKEFTYTSASN